MDPVKLFTVIVLVSLPTVMYGGYALLDLLSKEKLNEFQRTYFRAGHAHAGVLLVMTLATLAVLNGTEFGDGAALGGVHPAGGRRARAIRRDVPAHGHRQAGRVVEGEHPHHRRSGRARRGHAHHRVRRDHHLKSPSYRAPAPVAPGVDAQVPALSQVYQTSRGSGGQA